MKLERLSGCELGRLINKGEISPTEAIEYFKKRIEVRNPSLNAFTYTKFEDAFAEARKLEERLAKGEDCGPLAGVPIALKDFLPSKKGWTNSHGGVKALIQAAVGTSPVAVSMDADGATFSGQSLIGDLSISAPDRAPITAQVQYQGTGALTKTT
jgi:amidase/aspartyl-tRNA(Asn)/glutamyl-tRNA(Gln) amidotransferase subunit A